MNEPTALHGLPQTHMPELSNAMCGFDVVDRDGMRLGIVKKTSLSRTCIVVETPRRLLGRKQTHAVHALAVRGIDLDLFLIALTVSAQDVADAPDFHELSRESETTIARHYYDCLTGTTS